MADQPAPPDNEQNPENLPQPTDQDGTNAEEQPETTRLQKRKKLTLRNDTSQEVSPAETAEVPAPGNTDSGSALVDPTRKRNTNTASLKRLRPQNDISPDTDPDNTETVNIKVIKEQKKQFRNMMTSSQTLRVKPEDAAQAPDLAQTPSQPEQGGEDEAKRTLKIKAPAAETRTESIPRPTPGGGDPAQTQAEAPAPAAKEHSPKSTLKIKAPPGVAPAQAGGSKPGATLKIKAPAPAAAQTQAAPPPAAGKTVKQKAPAKAGKTLKLRQGTPPGQAAAQQAATAAEEEEYEEVDTSMEAGWGYLIPSAATIAAAAVLIFKIYQSSSELYGSLF